MKEIIYKKFEHKLMQDWEDLYKEIKGGYETHPYWCRSWYNHFGNNSELYIYTIWEKEKLVFLAPMHKKKKRLLFIGSHPNLFDKSSVLGKNKSHFDAFLKNILNLGVMLDFRRLISTDPFFQSLLKNLKSKEKKIYYYETIKHLRPYCVAPFEPTRSLKAKIRRIKNKLNKNGDYKINLDLSYDEKTFFNFITFHRLRWKTDSIFNCLFQAESFYRDIYKNTNLVSFSSLSISNEKPLVYMFRYKNLDSSLTAHMVARSSKIKTSIVTFLNYEIIKDCSYMSKEGSIFFDFGPSEDLYKYQFAQHEDILVDIVAIPTKTRFGYYFLRVFDKAKRIVAKALF